MMHRPLNILAISGSLRQASSNTAVLHAMAGVAPAGVTIVHYCQLGELPWFNPDLDSEGDSPPASVGELRALIGRCDGILISSPEYAHGVPGVLKNALDWLVSSLEFPGKPVALINTSPRSTYVHASLIEVLTTMSATLIDDPAFTIPLQGKRLDAAGMLGSPQMAHALSTAMAAFAVALMKENRPD